MSFENELVTLSADPLIATFDARVYGATDEDVDISLQQTEEYDALMVLYGHARKRYASTEDITDPEVRAYATGALTMLVTLIQHAKNQELEKQLGL